MPFETPVAQPRRIAIIGGGISGLAAAHDLSRSHRVTLFEAEPRLGGHARTVIAGKRGDQPVDTGFIVFNHANYPHLTRLFAELDVPTAPSSMSFGVSMDDGRFEYALHDLDSILAVRRNAVDPRYWRFLRDILRFNARAGALADDADLTIGGLIDALGLGTWFRDRYLLPFSGAIWSTPTRDILDFPAAAMLRFFENHRLLSYEGQHQWHTVRGGSIQYVQRLEALLRRRGVGMRLGSPVAGVRRGAGVVAIRSVGDQWEEFDHVIFATHSDQALALLADATEAEAAALGAVRYQPNTAVLHADPAMMPRRRKCWASWVYVGDSRPGDTPIGLTYWMNSLQPIPMDDPLFVSLNPTRPIRDELVHDTVTFAHPQYDSAALAGQAAVRGFNGARNTWFCGAWMRNGFHEDGFATALDVTRALQERLETMAAA